MVNVNKILLPYAYDSAGNLVYVDFANKAEKYRCPECQCELIMKKVNNKSYYERGNYYECKYTESVVLED